MTSYSNRAEQGPKGVIANPYAAVSAIVKGATFKEIETRLNIAESRHPWKQEWWDDVVAGAVIVAQGPVLTELQALAQHVEAIQSQVKTA